MDVKYLLPSATAGVVLGVITLTIGLPWWMWAIWAALTVAAAAQAVRA